MFLAFVSFLNVLDNSAFNFINKSLLQNTLFYASIRAIDGILSWLQTTGNIPFLGAVGQFLDPLNDFFEKISSVILITIASLSLQKILLIFSSNILIKFLCALCSLFFIALLWFSKKDSKIFLITLKILLTAFFIRFSLVIVLLLNGSVNFLLDLQLKSNMESISKVEEAINKTKENIQISPENQKHILEKNNKLEFLEKDLLEYTNKRKNLNEKASKIKDKIPTLGGLFNDTDYSDLRSKLKDIKAKESALLAKIKDNKVMRKKINNEIKDLEKDGIKISKIKNSIYGVLNIVQGHLVDFINIIIAFIIKNILVPLIFFYALIRVYKSLWKANL